MNDTYNPLCIKFREGGNEGKLGIWVGYDCCDLLIDPISLGNSLCISHKWRTINVMEDSNIKIYSLIDNTLRVCCWIVDSGIMMRRYKFPINEYVDAVKQVLGQLYQAIGSNYELAYESDPNLFEPLSLDDKIDIIYKQIRALGQTISLPHPLPLRSIKIESFDFRIEGEYGHDTHFEIRIGNRNYVNYITNSATNFEYIRHQLENIIYENEAQIKINNNFINAVTLHLQKIHTRELDYTVMKVTLFPYELNQPIISGYCDSKQVIRALYQGLLGITRINLDKDMSAEIADWGSYRLNIYNKLKSPLVEHYINRLRIYKQDDYITRQYHIKDIITINIDADADLWHNDGCVSGVLFEDTFEIDNLSIRIDGFERWRDEFTDAVDWSTSTVEEGFDWGAWHKRGLELAQQLRQQLPNEYELWYSAPFEDNSGTLKDDILIIKQ